MVSQTYGNPFESRNLLLMELAIEYWLFYYFDQYLFTLLHQCSRNCQQQIAINLEVPASDCAQLDLMKGS